MNVETVPTHQLEVSSIYLSRQVVSPHLGAVCLNLANQYKAVNGFRPRVPQMERDINWANLLSEEPQSMNYNVLGSKAISTSWEDIQEVMVNSDHDSGSIRTQLLDGVQSLTEPLEGLTIHGIGQVKVGRANNRIHALLVFFDKESSRKLKDEYQAVDDVLREVCPSFVRTKSRRQYEGMMLAKMKRIPGDVRGEIRQSIPNLNGKEVTLLPVDNK